MAMATNRDRNLFGALSRVNEYSNEVRRRAENVVSRLLGAEQSAGKAGAPSKAPVGLIELGLDCVDGIQDHLDRIGAALSRLEAALPEEVVGGPLDQEKRQGFNQDLRSLEVRSQAYHEATQASQIFNAR